jgi:hypothetical protein
MTISSIAVVWIPSVSTKWLSNRTAVPTAAPAVLVKIGPSCWNLSPCELLTLVSGMQQNQSGRTGEWQVMGPSKYQYRVIAEVSHQINSPLAAIRNALYLAAQHTEDGEVLAYLAIADAEVTSIVSRIKELRETLEAGGNLDFASAAPPRVQSLGKAA